MDIILILTLTTCIITVVTISPLNYHVHFTNISFNVCACVLFL